jgi:hypothetical protein
VLQLGRILFVLAILKVIQIALAAAVVLFVKR